MYKQSLQLKLRFETSKGLLSIEQLFDLNQSQLANVVRNLKKKIVSDTDNDLAFLDENAPQVNQEDQLRFDIAKDIYLTKKAERDEARTALEVKQHNQKIMELIQNKKDESLTQMSVEDLEKLLK